MRQGAKRLTIVAALLLTAQTPPPPALPTPPQTIWYVVAAENGQRVGYAYREIIDGPAGRQVTDYSQLRMRDENDPPQTIRDRTVVRIDPSGKVVAIGETSQVAGLDSSLEVRIGADDAEVIRETDGDRRTIRVPLPAGIRFDGGEGLLPGWDMRTTPRLTFLNFNLISLAPEQVVIEPVDGGAPDAEGRITVLRTRYDGNELRAVARLLLDRQRRVVAVTQPMFGTNITMRISDRETAERYHMPYRAMQNAMVHAPYTIPDGSVLGHLRYRFAYRGGLQFPLPQTGEQRVRAEAGAAIVDICPTCGPGLATDPATLADARRPTVWMQSDHPRLQAIAMPVSRMQITDTRKMQMLVSRARPLIRRVDYAGHFSALEALDRKAGDCTEAAVLLAALGRAAGIPTRVASGLAYSREPFQGVPNVFMPHSWVLAYVDGQWKSFDLALERFDSTHIALTVGDGDARSIMAASQLASLLSWETMVEVRQRPRT